MEAPAPWLGDYHTPFWRIVYCFAKGEVSPYVLNVSSLESVAIAAAVNRQPGPRRERHGAPLWQPRWRRGVGGMWDPESQTEDA